jgi:hypothetical protein
VPSKYRDLYIVTPYRDGAVSDLPQPYLFPDSAAAQAWRRVMGVKPPQGLRAHMDVCARHRGERGEVADLAEFLWRVAGQLSRMPGPCVKRLQDLASCSEDPS